MAHSVVAGPQAGFFARHWVGLLGMVVAGNALAVGAILFEPGPARAQQVVAAELDDADAAAPAGTSRLAVGAQSPEPAEAPQEKPVDLTLPGYLPPLKGMPRVAALPIGPDGQPMSPEVAEGFAMVEDFRGTLERLLGQFERAGRTTAAAEAFNLAFAAEAERMSQRATKLDVTKLPERDQTRLREHAEKILMPLIRRMQTLIMNSPAEPGQQDVEVAPEINEAIELDEPQELEEEPADPPPHEHPQDQADPPDPLTRAILE